LRPAADWGRERAEASYHAAPQPHNASGRLEKLQDVPPRFFNHLNNLSGGQQLITSALVSQARRAMATP
jgi:hypothetical protein